ncbi:GNAT family N-acetyltransferase [Halobacterium wangiae]|uniref:GNAT family N-acetyltransferase n=1 Tax=Halobacterium wangiae TaxID=2902623 RepID=UPI001E620F47|nr:GNAT family protein [Halobacterium wangiae]
MPGPVVERGERVTFRTVERSDAAFQQRATTDPRVRYLLGMAEQKNLEEAEDLVEDRSESDSNLSFVVCLDDEDAPDGHPHDEETTPIGMVHAHRVDGERAHLAYWLLPERHGEGYGTEAAELLVDLVFRTTSVHSVGAGAFAHNEASRGLLESLGFTQELRHREATYVDGEYRDFVNYGLLRREWAEE